MKRSNQTLTQLIKENKEEILKNSATINKIEQRVDENLQRRGAISNK